MKRFELFEKFLNKFCEKYQNLDSVVFSVDILRGGVWVGTTLQQITGLGGGDKQSPMGGPG